MLTKLNNESGIVVTVWLTNQGVGVPTRTANSGQCRAIIPSTCNKHNVVFCGQLNKKLYDSPGEEGGGGGRWKIGQHQYYIISKSLSLALTQRWPSAMPHHSSDWSCQPLLPLQWSPGKKRGIRTATVGTLIYMHTHIYIYMYTYLHNRRTWKFFKKTWALLNEQLTMCTAYMHK